MQCYMHDPRDELNVSYGKWYLLNGSVFNYIIVELRLCPFQLKDA